MELRDYFMDQIKRFGKALGMILSGILKLKRDGNFDEAFNYAEKAFRNDLKLDIKNMVDMSDDEFIKRIIVEKKLQDKGMETLAEILYELGEVQKTEGIEHMYLIRSLFIYEYLSENSQTYSLLWQNKINKIRNVLGTD